MSAVASLHGQNQRLLAANVHCGLLQSRVIRAFGQWKDGNLSGWKGGWMVTCRVGRRAYTDNHTPLPSLSWTSESRHAAQWALRNRYQTQQPHRHGRAAGTVSRLLGIWTIWAYEFHMYDQGLPNTVPTNQDNVDREMPHGGRKVPALLAFSIWLGGTVWYMP